MVFVEMGNEVPSPGQISVEIGVKGIKLNELLAKYPQNYQVSVVNFVMELSENNKIEEISIEDLEKKEFKRIKLKLTDNGKIFYRKVMGEYVKNL